MRVQRCNDVGITESLEQLELSTNMSKLLMSKSPGKDPIRDKSPNFSSVYHV